MTSPDCCGPETFLGFSVQVQHDLLPPAPLVPGETRPHVLRVGRGKRPNVDTCQLREGGEPVSDVDQPKEVYNIWYIYEMWFLVWILTG